MNEFITENLARRIYSANAKILNMERRYGKDSNIVKRAYDTIERIYGEGVTRYRYPRSASLREMQKISRGLSLVEKSLYASAEGRQKLREKAFSSFYHNESRRLSENKKGRVITEKNLEILYDIFEHATDWDRIRELAGYKQSIDTVDFLERQIEQGKDYDYIVDTMSEYLKSLEDGNQKDDFIDFFEKKLLAKK